jgi:hypothetical protein
MTAAEAVQAERKLSDSLEAFAGEWIAVVDHEVVANDKQLERLLDKVEQDTLEVATVFQVPQDHGAACFF